MYLKVKECGHNYVYFNVSVLIVFKLMTLNHSTIILKWKKDIHHWVLHFIITIGNFMCLPVICCS